MDGRGRIVLQNSVASAILERGPALWEQDGVLTAPGHERQLRRLIWPAGNTRGEVRATSLARPGGAAALVLLASAIAASAAGEAAESAVAAVLSGPDRRSRAPSPALCDLYGLTRSEVDLACHLAEGYRLADVARAVSASIHTVRGYLKRVFQKTNTRRQVEWVRLLLMTSVLRDSPADSVQQAGG